MVDDWWQASVGKAAMGEYMALYPNQICHNVPCDLLIPLSDFQDMMKLINCKDKLLEEALAEKIATCLRGKLKHLGQKTMW